MLSDQTMLWQTITYLIHAQFPQVRSLSVADLTAWLKQEPPSLLLLDVRKPEEYAVSHLPQAVLAPSDPEMLKTWETVTPETSIVVYCSIGYRSAKFAQQLQTMGYQQVFNLEGSIFAWANQGHPVYQGEQVVQHVHPYNAFWGVLLDAKLHP